MKHLYQRQTKNKILLANKGFTLIELLVGLAIVTILLLSFYSMFNYSVKVGKIGEEKEELILNGRYAIEYMKKEIKQAEKIMSTDKIAGFNNRFKENFGFTLKIKKNGNYKYVTYYLKRDNIFRIVSNYTGTRYPPISSFSGHNKIAGNIRTIKGSRTDFQNNTIILNILMDGKWNKDIQFKTQIFIRCPTIY